MKLLTRDEFRTQVFLRDNNKCIVISCSEDAVDAHHIYDRKLWDDNGYYLSNGASLCKEHHQLAERNIITPQTLRDYLKIKEYKFPKNLSRYKDYDKWGNELKIPNRNRPKYPTTYYFDFSYIPSNHTRDLGRTENLLNVPIVFTTKMDGSNVCLHSTFVAARNGLSAEHIRFDLLKAMHSKIKHEIPSNIIIFGEWLYAKHSIHYTNLSDYLQLFAVYDTITHQFFEWEQVESWAEKLRCTTVPVLKKTKISNKFELIAVIKSINDYVINKGGEGIVVRNSFPFHISKFSENVMKMVRVNHVQTDVHWSSQIVIKNKLKEK